MRDTAEDFYEGFCIAISCLGLTHPLYYCGLCSCWDIRQKLKKTKGKNTQYDRYVFNSTAPTLFGKYCLFVICILLLTGFEVWAHFSPLPAHKWNIIKLKEIDVADPGDFFLAVFGDNRNSKYVFENLLRLIDHDTDITFAVSLGDMVQKGEKERYRWFLQ